MPQGELQGLRDVACKRARDARSCRGTVRWAGQCLARSVAGVCIRPPRARGPAWSRRRSGRRRTWRRCSAPAPHPQCPVAASASTEPSCVPQRPSASRTMGRSGISKRRVTSRPAAPGESRSAFSPARLAASSRPFAVQHQNRLRRARALRHSRCRRAPRRARRPPLSARAAAPARAPQQRAARAGRRQALPRSAHARRSAG